MKLRLVIGLTVCLVAVSAAAGAQQRPLVTEDPETIGSGLVLLEGGVDVERDIFYPLSGLRGNLLRLPTLGISVGISSIAELQIDGGPFQRLHITAREGGPLAFHLNFTGDTTHDVQDIVVATKIRLLAEKPGRPAVGMRLATKLPNANNEPGIGTDTMDFYASLLIGKTVQSIRVVGNAGLGILSDPLRGDLQNDVFMYGLSFARAIQQGVEVVGEVNGRLDTRKRDNPIGTESRGTMRLGGRFTRGTVRVDGGLLIGMTSRDAGIGFTAGATWVFKGFTIP